MLLWILSVQIAQVPIFSSFRYIATTGLLDHIIVLFLLFWGSTILLFSTVALPCKVPRVLIFLPPPTFCVFDSITHTLLWVWVSHCGFDLHLFCFFSSISSLYIIWIIPYQVYHLQIFFFQFMDCLFTVDFVLSYIEDLNFDVSFTYFFFCCLCHSQEIIAQSNARNLSPFVFL